MTFRKHIVLLLFLVWLVGGCDMFSTRSPEPPDTGQSAFIPPTSPDILLSNFISAFEERNPENYTLCLGYESSYQFVPSANAVAIFSNIFDNWDISSERRYFLAMVASLPTGEKPFIQFIRQPLQSFPDSAIFIADYRVKIPIQTGETLDYAGQTQMTFFRSSTGLWSILRWVDLMESSSDNASTWSNFKADFFN